ncbi:MAG: L-serine ammonia-lyase, iron-sulfur-dependent, subunit alpha [Tissierellia bacterium]|nr:L-serine ammonia-lyase, iron-sulfur-dependent, subunit alpha [Tissierellia bacterium]
MYNKAEQLLAICEKEGISIAEATLRKIVEEDGKDRQVYLDYCKKVLEVMKSSSSRGLEEEVKTMSGLTGGNAKRLYEYGKTGQALSDELLLDMMARALSTLEVNGAMGKIVAAPTAGASGILPASLVSMQNKYGYDDDQLVQALLTASAVGAIVAMNATIAGAEGGCQAETGAAAAMSAAALVELTGGTPVEAFNAASFAIVNLLGLVCDPIAGLVEFPCALRNASGVSIAMISCDLAKAGVQSLIPFDEVVEAMYAVGRSMPAALRETALGGLAATKSGRDLSEWVTCGTCTNCS